MNKLVLCGLLLFLFAWLGCGGDDSPTEPDPEPEKKLLVATASAAPSMASVADPEWDRATAHSVALTLALPSPAIRQPNQSTLTVAKNVSVKGLVFADTLYLRFEWSDTSFSCWPDRFEVIGHDNPGGGLTYARFLQDTLSSKEDQVMVMFQEGTSTTWDVWQWRLLTTGAGGLAEGFNYNGSSLTRDAGSVDVKSTNAENDIMPLYMHRDGYLNTSHVLLDTDTTRIATELGLGWALGRLLPGWIIDTSLSNPSRVADAGSRFDIRAVSTYSAASDLHQLVLARALNTGHADDFVLAGPAEVNLRIGITNDLDFIFGFGDSNQGFSGSFKMVLP